MADQKYTPKGITPAEQEAFELSPEGCMCPNNGAGDCDWCQNRRIAEDAVREVEERDADR